MLRTALLTVGVLAVLPVSSARAAGDPACDAAYDQAQTFRDATKLTAAREQLRICGRSTCPASMASDCAKWLVEVDARIPSVVVVATDAAGVTAPNVTVSVDGAAPRPVDGRSWDVDPGQHTFTFVAPDGAKVDKGMLVLQGQKDQKVAVVLVPGRVVANLPTPAPAPPPPIVAAPAPLPADETPAAAPTHAFSYKPLGYAVGGVGVAGLIVGGIFGAVALSTKSGHCPTETTCDPGFASKVTTDATVSTVGIVAGGVLAAGGVALVLLAPKKTDAHAAELSAAPLVGGVSGVTLSGRWW